MSKETSSDPFKHYVKDRECDKCAHFDICVIYRQVEERLNLIALEHHWGGAEAYMVKAQEELWHVNPKDLAKICRLFLPKLGLDVYKTYLTPKLGRSIGDDIE